MADHWSDKASGDREKEKRPEMAWRRIIERNQTLKRALKSLESVMKSNSSNIYIYYIIITNIWFLQMTYVLYCNTHRKCRWSWCFWVLFLFVLFFFASAGWSNKTQDNSTATMRYLNMAHYDIMKNCVAPVWSLILSGWSAWFAFWKVNCFWGE